MHAKAKKDGRYGAPGVNVGIENLVAQFKRLAVEANGCSGRLRFRSSNGKRLGPSGAKVAGFDRPSHIEGLARVPDPHEHNWFVFSRATEFKEDLKKDLGSKVLGGTFGGGEGAAGFLLAQMSAMNGNGGERLVPGIDLDTFDDVDATGGAMKYFKQIPDTAHLGGIQMLGTTLFAPIESARPRVELYDLSGKENPVLISTIHLPVDKRAAHYVSAVRLASDRVFVIVNRSDSGCFDSFLSPRGELGPHTQWRYLGRSDFSKIAPTFPTDTDWSVMGENDNFAIQCASLVFGRNSGRIFLMTFRQKDTSNPLRVLNWETDNIVELFRFGIRSAGLKAAKSADLFAPRDPAEAASFEPASPAEQLLDVELEERRQFRYQKGSKMRGAASAHVTPSGRLIVYAGPQTGKDGKLRMGEITAD